MVLYPLKGSNTSIRMNLMLFISKSVGAGSFLFSQNNKQTSYVSLCVLTFTISLLVLWQLQMELERRKLILHKFLENPTWSIYLIGKSLHIPTSTVHDVLTRYKKTLTIDRAKHCRKKGTLTTNIIKKLVRSAKKNPDMSLRDRARKFGVSHMGVKRGLAMEGYRSFCAIKAPNRNEKAAKSAKLRMRKLYDTVLKNYKGCILMDDEHINVRPQVRPLVVNVTLQMGGF